MIEIIDGTWTAGETKTFHINGERIEILDAQYALDVYLMDKSGAQMSVMKKSEASFFSQPKEGFNSLQIYSAQAQYIRFFVGSGDAGTRRISSTVQVVDGGKARTQAGASGVASAQTSAVAGQNALAGLWNPAGSGRRLIVKRAFVSTGTAQPMYIGRVSVAPATLATPQSMLVDGAAFAGVGKSAGANVAGLGGFTPIGAFTQSVSPVLFSLDEPFVIRPGNGLMFATSMINTDVSLVMPFFEEVE